MHNQLGNQSTSEEKPGVKEVAAVEVKVEPKRTVIRAKEVPEKEKTG